MSMAAPAGFHGRQSPTEQRYEAHLFLTGNDADIDGIVELARRRRFMERTKRSYMLNSGRSLLRYQIRVWPSIGSGLSGC